MHNVGKIDRIIRISVAGVIAILYFTNIIDGNFGKTLAAIGVILAITSLRRCCPIYALLGFGTCSTNPEKSDIKIETEKLNIKN